MSPSHPVTVLHVLVPAPVGGLESVVLDMATALRTTEFSPVILAVLPGRTAPEHPFVLAARARGAEVLAVRVPTKGYVAEYGSVHAAIAQLRPVLVHTHGYRADLISGLVARHTKVPWVVTSHGFVGGDVKNRFYEWLQVRALRRANAVIAVSRPIAKRLELSRVPKRKICIIPNARISQPIETKSAARRILGIEWQRKVIGWVGRLSPEKGADVLLYAVAALPDRDWCLVIIGDGPERVRLAAQAEVLGIASQIVWCGSIPNASRLFSAFDVLVLSSRTEGTPVVLLEAMAAGVPIIATRVGGVPDLIASAEGILCPSGQPASIAAAITDTFANPAAASVRAIAAMRKVTSEFDVTDWIASYLRVYRSCLR